MRSEALRHNLMTACRTTLLSKELRCKHLCVGHRMLVGRAKKQDRICRQSIARDQSAKGACRTSGRRKQGLAYLLLVLLQKQVAFESHVLHALLDCTLPRQLPHLLCVLRLFPLDRLLKLFPLLRR